MKLEDHPIYAELDITNQPVDFIIIKALTTGSRRHLNWVCKLNHVFSAQVAHRINGSGCPYCAGNKILPGFNDLATTVPGLLKEWDFTRNTVDPSQVGKSYRGKVFWVCANNHEWETTVRSRGVLGTNCPYCAGRKSLEEKKISQAILLKEWDYNKNSHNPGDYSSGSNSKVWWICSKNIRHCWAARISDRVNGGGCPKCNYSNRSSKAEVDLKEFFSSLDINFEVGSRKVIPPYELDFYFPSAQVAVEFNGLYWHTENAGKDKTYHFNKWKLCKEKGIQLIQIWEDGWSRNPDLIKKMLTHKLKLSSQKKISGRKTTPIVLTQTQVNAFLEANHIQGSATGSVRIGLTTIIDGKEVLVSVMVLKIESNSDGKHLNLLRFATCYQVQGGFTKLLKYVKQNYAPKKIITFSDNTVSDGGLYKNTGFEKTKVLPPDYMYVVNNQRKHKFNYRIARFRNDSSLEFEEGLSERQLAQLNKISRIWDAGKIKWIKNVE